MRILHTVLDDGWGGREQRILETASWQQTQGHQVWLAAPEDNDLTVRAADRRLPVFPLSHSRFSAAEALHAIRRGHRIDVIDCHGRSDAEAVVHAGLSIPIVYTFHRLVNSSDITRQSRAVWQRVDRVIAVAKAIEKSLLDHTLIEPARLCVVGEWVPPEFFDPLEPDDLAATCLEIGIVSGRPTVAFVAMMREEKGLAVFLEACKLVRRTIPELQILVVGSDDTTTPGADLPVFRQLRSLAERLGLSDSLVFTGFREDVRILIHLANLVIVPSLREAQSKVIPESFACGTPVIASKVGGIPELITHGITGWLVAPGDAHRLAQQMVACLRQPSKRAAIAHNARQFARDKLDLNDCMEQTLCVYRSAGNPSSG